MASPLTGWVTHLTFNIYSRQAFNISSRQAFNISSQRALIFHPGKCKLFLASVRGGWDLGAHACLATGFLLTMLGMNTMS